ncbi:MAG: RDD family protein [Pseudomonadota bacterium]
MTSNNRLPAMGGAAWQGAALDPLADPALYDGIRWRRVFGYVVDLALIGFVSLVVWFLLAVAGVASFGLLLPLLPIGVALVPLAYHTLQVASPRSATVGMRLFDVEVRAWTGTRPDLWQAFLMTALFLVTVALTGSLILLVSLFNGRGRTLHDYLSGTVVVRASLIAG